MTDATETMEAMVLVAHGGPESLSWTRVPAPVAGPGEVRVRVHAVAMNHMDLWVRRGGPAFRVELPHRLGCDIAGTVDSVGAGVSGVEVGARCVVNPGTSCGRCEACLRGDDPLCRRYRILGEHVHGGYARFVVVPAANILPYPGELSFEQAAAVPLVFLTAWRMLVTRARVVAGEWVLVQGGGSGVGSAAIQIAKLCGARVIATAGSRDKAERARALGADEVIDYSSADFVAETKRITGGRGADVVIEHVGGETFGKSVVATRSGGRLVTCGATSGFTPTVDLRHVFFRQVQVLGSTMGSKGDLFAVLPLVAQGKLRPVVDRVLPLKDAAEGHRALESRSVFGKIVLNLEAG